MSKPKFFKYAFLAGGLTKLSSALSVSLNTLMVAFGASAFQIGIVNTLKFVGESLSQFFGLYFLNLFSSLRKAQIWSMVLTALPNLLLASIALAQAKYWFVFIALIMFFSGLIGRSSYLCWYSWMSSIVPTKQRNHFFGTRSSVGQIFGMIGFLIAFFVLKLNFSTLLLLGLLYLSAYAVDNIELGTYFLHPDKERKKLFRNNVLKRMWSTIKNKRFARFFKWYNILNVVLLANILYLEYFMIHNLKQEYYWIPISFVIISISSAFALLTLRIYFADMNYSKKLLLTSFTVLASSSFWLLTHSISMLILSLILAGFASGALVLVQKVELINHAKKDKESYYALFNFIQSISAAIFIFALNMLQFFRFNFYTVFYFTIPLSLLSIYFIKE